MHLSRTIASQIALRGTTITDWVRAIHPVRGQDSASPYAFDGRLRSMLLGIIESIQNDDAHYQADTTLPSLAMYAPWLMQPQGTLPSWVSQLTTILRQYAPSFANLPNDDAFMPDRPIPFEHALLPFLACYRAELRNTTVGASSLLSQAARISLERNLLRTLAHWSLLPLFLEFQVFSEAAPAELRHDKSPNPVYRAFINHLHAGAYIDFFAEYSVLARLLTTITINTATADGELLRRYSDDRDSIESTFSVRTGEIRTIEAALSDPHFGHRTVAILELDDGFRLVYKPKAIDIEGVFADLLASITTGFESPPRTPRSLAKDRYGWVEAINRGDSAPTALFHRNTGRILSLVHWLNGTDLHHENVIATEYAPILIDLEALFSLPSRAQATMVTRVGIHSPILPLNETVLRTGLLPSWQRAPDGTMYDVSGLCAGEHESDFPWYEVSECNSDSMSIAFRKYAIKPNPASASVFKCGIEGLELKELERGFAEAFEASARGVRDMLANNTRLQVRAQHCLVRRVFRASRFYGRLLQRITQPACLRTGIALGRQLLSLTHVLDNAPNLDEVVHLERIVFSEMEAIESGDIPHFSCAVNGRDLLSGNYELCSPDYYPESAWAVIHKCANRSTHDDLHAQLMVIKSSVYARFPDHSISTYGSSGKSLTVSAEFLMDIAVKIGEAIRNSRILRHDGVIGWVGVRNDNASEQVEVYSTDMSLYDGQVGIALFLIALGAATGREEFQSLGLSAVQALEVRLRDDRGWKGMLGTGGMAGVLFGLCAIRRLIGPSECDFLVNRLVEQAKALDVVDDGRYDVMSGAAGAVLALARYMCEYHDDGVVRTITLLARHLCDNRTVDDQGASSWLTIAGQPALAGFAHGSAGIGYALVRAHKASGETDFLKVFQESLAFEDGFFEVDHGTWADRRTGASSHLAFNESWCHGTVGIGLARLGTVGENAHARFEDVDAAIGRVLREPPARVASLCCGELGAIDMLIEAALRTERFELIDVANQRLAPIARQCERMGTLPLFTGRTAMALNPGLFQGSAGVGYMCLRLINPRRFETVLLP